MTGLPRPIRVNAPVQVRVELGSWAELKAELEPLRREVFIVEQSVPEALEWDDDDASSVHALARIGDDVVACGRLLEDGHIGRMAVRKSWRLRGIGRSVLDALIAEAARRGLSRLVLNAQTHALGFYERAGFLAEGEEFDDAGIPHRRMILIAPDDREP